MNTAQLIVLWYAGLVTAAILVFQTFGRESASFLIAAIALLAALLIYTLKPHPSARKRWVLLAVGGPLLLGPLAFYGWWSYEERISAREQIREALLIPSERVELVGLELREQLGSLHLTGRVRNRSPHVLRGVDIEVAVFEGRDKIETKSVHLWLEVPPGEARDFDEYVSLRSKFKRGMRWEYRITGTRGEPGG